MSLMDMVQQHLGQNELQQISQQLGADPAQTQSAVQAALPMLLGGMASQAQQPGGQQQVQQAMDAHASLLGSLGGLGGMLGGGSGGIGGALGGLLGGGLADGGGGGLLGKVLGQHQDTVQTGVQQASGLSSDQTKRLLMILAPMVLAMLAKRHQNAGQADVNATLQQEAQHAQQAAPPQVGGILGKILGAVTSPPR